MTYEEKSKAQEDAYIAYNAMVKAALQNRCGCFFSYKCSLHKAAPAMYEALKAILEEPNFGLPGKLFVKANTAISLAEGKE